MAALVKRRRLNFHYSACKTSWRSWFRSYKCIKDYPKHVPKPSKSALKFDLSLIFKAVLMHQSSKTGTFQNLWKICYFSNIPMTYISVGDINLGNKNPQSELICDVILIFKKMSNLAGCFSWIVTMFLVNFGRKYCSNTVWRIKWPHLFHIWAI